MLSRTCFAISNRTNVLIGLGMTAIALIVAPPPSAAQTGPADNDQPSVPGARREVRRVQSGSGTAPAKLAQARCDRLLERVMALQGFLDEAQKTAQDSNSPVGAGIPAANHVNRVAMSVWSSLAVLGLGAPPYHGILSFGSNRTANLERVAAEPGDSSASVTEGVPDLYARYLDQRKTPEATRIQKMTAFKQMVRAYENPSEYPFKPFSALVSKLRADASELEGSDYKHYLNAIADWTSQLSDTLKTVRSTFELPIVIGDVPKKFNGKAFEPLIVQDSTKYLLPSDVMNTLARFPNLSKFTSLLNLSGLAGYIKASPVTVFAPDNTACVQLYRDGLQWQHQNDLGKLRDVLKNYFVPGKYMLNPGKQSDVQPLGNNLETAAGLRMGVRQNGNATFVFVSNSSKAQITRPDILAANGIIHVVNAELSPKPVRID